MLGLAIRGNLRRARQPMAQQFALTHDTPAYNPRYADAFVVFSVTVLSLAIGVWCMLRLGLTLWMGTVAALAVYAVLLLVHLGVRRSLIAVEDASVEREAGDIWTQDPSASVEPRHDADVPGGSKAPHSPDEEIARWTQTARAGEKSSPEVLPRPRSADPFDFRPKQEPSLPNAPAAGGLASLSARELKAAEPRASGPVQPEMSVELVQDLIKKLADELNSTTAAERADKPIAPGTTEAMIGRSVAALQATARTMPGPHADLRAAAPGEGSRGPAIGGAPSWWPAVEPASSARPGARAPSEPPPLNPQLARIAEAVAAGRMEVLLEPIHQLAEGRPRHFEVSVRLLTADGSAIEQGEVARAAQGSGLMPRIDAARMIRAARVARRLGERGRQGSVLASVAGESITHDDFVVAAVEEPAIGGNMSLVLSFAQSEMRTLTPAHTQALAALSTVGFRFALEEVTDLDMDFAALKEMGFAFVELDAPVFLDGLPAATGRVPASDICRHLADFGLTLIVGRIEDDWLLARILGFGVLFGKGALFGAPRLVKDEVVAAPAAA
jgi:cyclic-di-GMP phosphodiesterase, flagellum assembly factor TipF